MLHPTERYALKRGLLPYLLVIVLFLVGSTVVSGIADGRVGMDIARRAFNTTSWAIGAMASIGVSIVWLNRVQAYLARVSQSSLYHWPSELLRVAVKGMILVAAFWAVGHLVGEGLKGLWGWQWNADKIARETGRAAAIGALFAAAAIALQWLATDRSQRHSGAA